jgi:uncharacterized protein (DUF1800 family)
VTCDVARSVGVALVWRLEAEGQRRETVEEELRGYQASARAERDGWEAKAMADMEVRRKAMEEERQQVISLESKLQQLQAWIHRTVKRCSPRHPLHSV